MNLKARMAAAALLLIALPACSGAQLADAMATASVTPVSHAAVVPAEATWLR